MVKAQASVFITKPVENVFDFVAVNFFDNYPRWSPEVVDLRAITAPPVRVGTAARQVRVDQGRRTESTFRFSRFEAGECIAFQGTSNPFLIVYKLDPQDGNTRLTFTFELSRLEIFMRPFEKLLRIAIQDGAERVVYNIKGLVELD